MVLSNSSVGQNSLLSTFITILLIWQNHSRRNSVITQHKNRHN